MSHLPEQVISDGAMSGEYGRWGRIFQLSASKVSLTTLATWPSVVVLKDHFVMSFGILGAFKLQCSAQLHQLLLVTFRNDGFVRLE